jgi:multiple sugar transport system permease protein
MKKWLSKYSKHYLMLLPFFVCFAIFFLYPIGKGFAISFFKWDSVHTPEYVGLQNYVKVITSRDFIKSFTNLLKYVCITVPVGITVAFLLALFVDGLKGFWANFFRSAYFIPTMIPMFLAASIWRWLYAPDVGFINTMLGWVGLPSVNWLKDPNVMLFALIVVDVWRAAGFNMVILLAGLKNISPTYYDAAKVDGANKFQEIIYVTIPLLEPVLFFTISYGFISALQVFDAPWLLTISNATYYGGRMKALMFPVMDLMGRAFGALKFGESAAYGFILTLLIVMVTALQFVLRRKN